MRGQPLNHRHIEKRETSNLVLIHQNIESIRQDKVNSTVTGTPQENWQKLLHIRNIHDSFSKF